MCLYILYIIKYLFVSVSCHYETTDISLMVVQEEKSAYHHIRMQYLATYFHINVFNS